MMGQLRANYSNGLSTQHIQHSQTRVTSCLSCRECSSQEVIPTTTKNTRGNLCEFGACESPTKNGPKTRQTPCMKDHLCSNQDHVPLDDCGDSFKASKRGE